MNRRNFLKISGMVGAAAATAGMDFVALPAGKETVLEDPSAIRWNVSVTHRWEMTHSRHGVLEKEIQRMIDYARFEARTEAENRGWKNWKETVVKTTPKEMDADRYEVVLLKPKSKIAEVLSRYVQRDTRSGNGRSSVGP